MSIFGNHSTDTTFIFHLCIDIDYWLGCSSPLTGKIIKKATKNRPDTSNLYLFSMTRKPLKGNCLGWIGLDCKFILFLPYLSVKAVRKIKHLYSHETFNILCICQTIKRFVNTAHTFFLLFLLYSIGAKRKIGRLAVDRFSFHTTRELSTFFSNTWKIFTV